MELYEQITKIISGDVVIRNLKKYSIDWSLFSVMPAMVVQPKNVTDIEKIVQFVLEHKKEYPELSITARAAGTDMTGGPLNHSIILDITKYLSGVKNITRVQGDVQKSFYGHPYTITGEAIVLPGTYYRDFEPKTLKQGLVLPCYPASKDLCAIGGMVANNGAGEKTLKYGQNKDFVKSLRVVLSDGHEYQFQPLTFSELTTEIAKADFLASVYQDIYTLVKNNWKIIQEKKPITSKNASGYYLWDVVQAESIASFEQGNGYFDITKLIVGAQGTTGIITEVTYKLVDVELAHDLLVVYIKDLAVIPKLVEHLMKFNLEMLEMYDDNTFKLGVKFFRDFLKDKGFFGALRYGLRFLPELWMTLVQGIPKLLVLVEFSGNNERELHTIMRQAQTEMNALKLTSRRVERDVGEEKFWDFRHDSFKILTEHSKTSRTVGEGVRTVPFIDDIVVNPEYLPEYLPQLIKILDAHKLLYTIAGHLGNGNFHIIPLMDIATIGDGKKILEISEQVYNLALEYHASLSAEHNDGIIRTPFLEKQFGKDIVVLFEQVKYIFDPQNIFNPGKKVHGTFEDIRKSLL